MDQRALRAALLKLAGSDALPASRFTTAQRDALDRFARQTGAVGCQRRGSGDVYRVLDADLFASHLAALSPQAALPAAPDVPARARHIGHSRTSKAGDHRHAGYYPIIKAVGAGVCWRDDARGTVLALDPLTRDFGAASLRLQAGDAGRTEQALWLVENQDLFDRTDWLPANTVATLLYYGGQLDGRLLAWLAGRPRARRIVHFADYDGVGLANFARLHALLGDACEYWLMPDWSDKLAHYGSNRLWRDTLREFTAAAARLPDYLLPLTRQMQQSGLALEQEAVWLRGR
jgi:hypothetical protein